MTEQMHTWIIPMFTGAGATVTVQAETYEGAIEAAENEGVGSLCHQCASIELGDFEPSETHYWKDDEFIEMPAEKSREKVLLEELAECRSFIAEETGHAPTLARLDRVLAGGQP